MPSTSEVKMSESITKPPYDLRAAIAGLELTLSGFARRLQELGDDRSHENILRSVQRMISGDARVSGEMRALIGLLKEAQAVQQTDAENATI
jgi:hypothetical protein